MAPIHEQDAGPVPADTKNRQVTEGLPGQGTSARKPVTADDRSFYRESSRRSIVKSLSYRCLGVLVTSAVAMLITGEVELAAAIGLLDTVVKLGVYYAHERLWNRISFGRPRPPEYEI